MTTTSVVIKLFLDIPAFCSIISNMFGLFPKKKTVDEMLKNVNTTCLGLTWIPEDSAKKDAVIKNLREQQEFLYKENEELKKILENIEEDGTYEHNNAIKLREENAELRSKFDEFVKEILGLRHLKEENVQLMERINKLIEDGTRVCVENASLKESNVQLMDRVNEIDSDMNKEYQAEIFILKNEIAMLKAKYQILEHNYQGCTKYRDEYKHQLNAANKEIEKLKNDIIDYVIEKEEEQKHPMYPIHWGGLDPDILKQAQEQSIEEVVDALKGVETQGFESQCDEVKKSQGWSTFKVAINEAVQEKQREVYGIEEKKEKQKQIEFNSEELLKRVTEFADSITGTKAFPKDLFDKAKGLIEGVKVDLEAPLTDLPKSFPNEFQEETTAENLEEKFDKGEDVLDYFEKPWQCPCNKCKEIKTEETWEQAASDLALRVVKLEQKLEELTITKITSDPNYKYFLEHGKWPYSAMNPDGTLKTINCNISTHSSDIKGTI